MNKNVRIFIAGHRGLVGSAILGNLKKKGYKNLIYVTSKKLDLRDYNKVKIFFKKKKIQYVVIAAARVGGIIANSTFPTEFYLDNTRIQNNIMKNSLEFKIKRVVFMGSSCLYPKFAKTPIKEEFILTGKLEPTNIGYSMAKLGGFILCQSMYNQYGLDSVCVMPTNVYGKNDNFDKSYGHVVPAMITKFLNKKKQKKKIVELYGTGKPKRELIHADDLAEAIHIILKSSKKKLFKVCNNSYPMINVGTGDNISMKKLAKMIKKLVEYKGKFFFNSKYPDGVMKKNLDSRKINKLGWSQKIGLEEGLKEVIKYRSN